MKKRGENESKANLYCIVTAKTAKERAAGALLSGFAVFALFAFKSPFSNCRPFRHSKTGNAKIAKTAKEQRAV
jgi:hypothetical protein